ncbi:YggS family pyridoxal phosphate-dependent enzyme [Paraburkholderia hayleyella]|uniref:YggS family pyridoxal phosphate-dependent enzyme n=1 Tax=Paraburkholderia hayleyella TaxID=2152889 RepID=UPI001290E4B4|nr:YggS family pyridoxal phosphate-dependent enzyme [Paraburkholderia hayleyella]
MEFSLATNIERITNAIRNAEIAHGRYQDTVTLVAASKNVAAADIQAAIDLGLRIFGENRVQEVVAKWTDLRAANPGVALHLIGPLQSNKARQAVALFDVIESVDRTKLAQEIAEEAEKQGRNPTVNIQVNIGNEPQKSGVLPADTPSLIEACRNVYHLNVQGLMCIPPAGQDPSSYFLLLKSIAADHGLPILSMGMSADFAQAIAHGATHVRVGSAIFGDREPVVQ